MRKFGRWAKDHLNINKRTPSQFITRSLSAEPPVTDDLQGIPTKHCPSIRIDPLVKICRCLKVHLLVPHRHNVAVSLSCTIGCHQDVNRALQVQIYETTPRMHWMEQIWTLKMRNLRVSPCSNLSDSGTTVI